jgi:hypothetical protein
VCVCVCVCVICAVQQEGEKRASKGTAHSAIKKKSATHYCAYALLALDC